MRTTALTGMELADALNMATECAIAAGDLESAGHLADRSGELPFHREEGHLATARPLVVTALSGDWDRTLALAERFREGWERAGRPRTSVLTRAAYAAATVHGLRGNDGERASWLDIADDLASPGCPVSEIHFAQFFDAWLLLHRGLPDQVVPLMDTAPEDLRAWHSGMWRPWYAALWAEAAVLTKHDEATPRIQRARRATVDNPIATAIVARAAALADGDRDGLLAAAAALDAGRCRYQWARTLIMADGGERARGDEALAAMGATAMVWP